MIMFHRVSIFKEIVALVILFLFVSTKTTYSFDNNNLPTRTHIITDNHINLVTSHCRLYAVPFEHTFVKGDTNTMVGFSSEKYPLSRLRFTWSGIGYLDTEEKLEQYNILEKFPNSWVNNYFKLWAYKLQHKTQQDAPIIWKIFLADGVSYVQGEISYPDSLDVLFSNGIVELINSIVLVSNPAFAPSYCIWIDGDFDLLDLTFVKKQTAPLAYFTVDGLTIENTKYSKFVALGNPTARQTRYGRSADALWTANRVLSMNDIEETLLIEKIEETVFDLFQGLLLKGSVKDNPNKLFWAYYYWAPAVDFILFGYCEEEESVDFFKRLDDFQKTMSLLY